jgi:phenylalanyl-tRNA synthetase alpha chain
MESIIQSNIPVSILNKIGLNLHNKKNHPINIIKKHIYKYFDSLPYTSFKKFDEFDPYVSVTDNFDLLRIPKDHVARSVHDTYYKNENTVLRTHTSAHQNQLLKAGETSFLVTGDVYRKDEIDSCHFNVFHQMEIVHRVPKEFENESEIYLKKILSGLIEYLFPNCDYEFQNDYFPFTEPSFEANVKYKEKWLEILGCGIVHQEILKNCNLEGQKFIAIGLGIDRLCMILFNIPDIRLIWSTDDRVLSQFKDGDITTQYKPVPQLKSITKDISFWIKSQDVKDTENLKNEFEWIIINDFYDKVRNLFGDSVERVELLDKFYNPKKDKYSHTFRLTFTPNVYVKNPGDFTKEVNDNMVELVKSVLSIIDSIR